jgi:serine/threonine-protein phosphatase 2A regulatory subunit A
MAEELGKFIPLVGGPAHGHVLLMPLEALSMVEETVVRDKAVESINLIAAELPEASIAEHLIPLVQVSAVAAAWRCRCAAAGLWRGTGPGPLLQTYCVPCTVH